MFYNLSGDLDLGFLQLVFFFPPTGWMEATCHFLAKIYIIALEELLPAEIQYS